MDAAKEENHLSAAFLLPRKKMFVFSGATDGLFICLEAAAEEEEETGRPRMRLLTFITGMLM